MLIDILKDKCNTSDTRTALIQAWSRDIISIGILATKIDLVARDCMSQMRNKPVHSAYKCTRENTANQRSSRQTWDIDGQEAFNFAHGVLEIKIRMFERYSSANEAKLRRQTPRIEETLNAIFGSDVQIRVYSSSTSVIISCYFSCDEDSDFFTLFPHIQLVNKMNYEISSATIGEVSHNIEQELITKMGDEYSYREYAISEIDSAIDEFREQIDELSRKIQDARSLKNTLQQTNTDIFRHAVDEEIRNRGYIDTWDSIRTKIVECVSKYETMREHIANRDKNIKKEDYNVYIR